jgi:hypothetical protein
MGAAACWKSKVEPVEIAIGNEVDLFGELAVKLSMSYERMDLEQFEIDETINTLDLS